MTSDKEPDLDLDSYLEGSLDTFEHEVRRRFDDPEDAKLIWGLSERVAKFLHDDASTLASSGVAGYWAELRSGLEAHPLHEELQYGLQAHLAWTLLPSFRKAAERCWDLAQIATRTEPTEQVQRFLRRVSRCYLLSMEAECLVMCRGAFDSALAAKYSAEGIAKPDGMKRKIREAARRGWLDPDLEKPLYDLVWQRGSKAAHADPEAVGGSLESIRLTVRALSSLKPPANDDS